jgi:hypothetical protein
VYDFPYDFMQFGAKFKRTFLSRSLCLKVMLWTLKTIFFSSITKPVMVAEKNHPKNSFKLRKIAVKKKLCFPSREKK